MPFLRDQQEEEQENPYFSGEEEEYPENILDPLNEDYDQNRFTDYPLNYDNMSNDTASPQSGDDYYNNMIKNERGPAQNNDTGPEEKSQEDNKKKPKEEKDNKLDKAAGALEKVPGPVGTVAKVYKHKKIIILALFVIITFQILVVVMFVGMLGSRFGGVPSAKTGPSPTIGSLEVPPNLGGPDQLGYYTLPNDSVYGGGYGYGAGWQACNKKGSMELMQVLYTVSKKFAEKYPKNKFWIGDLNSNGHKTHKTGRDVDLDIPGGMMIDGGNYNRQLAIDAGKLLVDTKLIRWIYYNDTAVQAEVNKYSASKGLKNPVMKTIGGHENHFHIRLEIKDGPIDTRCPQN